MTAAVLDRPSPSLAATVTERAVLHALNFGGPASSRRIAASLDLSGDATITALDSLSAEGLVAQTQTGHWRLT